MICTRRARVLAWIGDFYIWKISICGGWRTQKRFSKYCSRFCFRILRISSFDSWLNCHQFKFQIFYSSYTYGRASSGWRWESFWRLLNCEARETHFLGKIKRDLTQSALWEKFAEILCKRIELFCIWALESVEIGWKFLKRPKNSFLFRFRYSWSLSFEIIF